MLMLPCKLYDVEDTAAAPILLSISLRDIPSAGSTAVHWPSMHRKVPSNKNAAC